MCVCVRVCARRACLGERGECGIVWLAGCRRCHKPQDVESHLSLSLSLSAPHTHTHGCSMYRQGETLIIGLEELPGAAYNLLIENLTHTHTHTPTSRLRECSTGHKISYFTMILQSSQNSEMRFVFSSTLQCVFSVHQPPCGLFARHTVYSTNVSKQSKHLQDSVLLSFG